MNQRERILRHIRKHGSITSMEAFDDLGIQQLSARICELQRMGYRFIKSHETGKNRFGEKVWFVRYRLLRGDEK